MLLTITTRSKPAGNLSFLLHKHPNKLQSFDLSIGKAHVYYPESSDEKTSCALLLDIDPIDMVRGTRSSGGFSLSQYVNDRPYVAASFMSVAIAKAFSTAMNGTCKNKPELVDVPMDLEAQITVVAAPKGGERLIRTLFKPLGYKIELERHILDEQFPDWGESKYFTLNLKHTIPLQTLLTHLYVLLPALDNEKHYYVSKSEVDKLLDKGKGWLADHPAREQIVNRYLINLRSFSRVAIERLDEEVVHESDEKAEEEGPVIEKKKESLHQRRLKLVLAKLKESGASSVIDMGCGEGKLLKMLLKERQFRKITGTDVSYSELAKAKSKLHWDDLAPKQKERLDLFQGALTYKDKRLAGYDGAAIVEVIEHLDEDRLTSFERVIFEFAKPKQVIITTPNSDYNVLYENMEAGDMRHNDHRFEWSRKEFKAWAEAVANRNNYSVEILPIGDTDENVGAPSQMGIFKYGN